MKPSSMKVTAIRGSIFKPKQSLEKYILRFIPRASNGSIIVVTSKIVALAQGRTVANQPGEKIKWIKRESDVVIKTQWCYLTLKDGHWCPNAGIDESNAKGLLILWPKNIFQTADQLRATLLKSYGVKKLGVLITDSRIFPLRAGVTGVSLGYAGFKGLRDYRETKDIFGRKLKLTQTNIADSLASAAVLVIGEGKEQTPLGVIENAPVQFTNQIDSTELNINPKYDLYRPLFDFL